MLGRRRMFDHSTFDDIVAFVAQHSVGERLTFAQLRTLLIELPSSPAAVFDIEVDGERVLVASLIDTVVNSTNSAELALLGWRAEAIDRDLFDELLSFAEAVTVTGPRQHLGVLMPSSLKPVVEVLSARGYALGYVTFDMQTTKIDPPAPLRMPTTLRWEEASQHQLVELYDLVRAAFAEVPGAHLPSFEQFASTTLNAPIRARLLMENQAIIGFFKVDCFEDATGWVQLLGRHPHRRGQRVGEILLSEAMRVLADHGAERYRLSVSATNRAALELYRRYGFEVVDERPTYLWSVPLRAVRM